MLRQRVDCSSEVNRRAVVSGCALCQAVLFRCAQLLSMSAPGEFSALLSAMLYALLASVYGVIWAVLLTCLKRGRLSAKTVALLCFKLLLPTGIYLVFGALISAATGLVARASADIRTAVGICSAAVGAAATPVLAFAVFDFGTKDGFSISKDELAHMYPKLAGVIIAAEVLGIPCAYIENTAVCSSACILIDAAAVIALVSVWTGGRRVEQKMRKAAKRTLAVLLVMSLVFCMSPGSVSAVSGGGFSRLVRASAVGRRTEITEIYLAVNAAGFTNSFTAGHGSDGGEKNFFFSRLIVSGGCLQKACTARLQAVDGTVPPALCEGSETEIQSANAEGTAGFSPEDDRIAEAPGEASETETQTPNVEDTARPSSEDDRIAESPGDDSETETQTPNVEDTAGPSHEDGAVEDAETSETAPSPGEEKTGTQDAASDEAAGSAEAEDGNGQTAADAAEDEALPENEAAGRAPVLRDTFDKYVDLYGSPVYESEGVCTFALGADESGMMRYRTVVEAGSGPFENGDGVLTEQNNTLVSDGHSMGLPDVLSDLDAVNIGNLMRDNDIDYAHATAQYYDGIRDGTIDRDKMFLTYTSFEQVRHACAGIVTRPGSYITEAELEQKLREEYGDIYEFYMRMKEAHEG